MQGNRTSAAANKERSAFTVRIFVDPESCFLRNKKAKRQQVIRLLGCQARRESGQSASCASALLRNDLFVRLSRKYARFRHSGTCLTLIVLTSH